MKITMGPPRLSVQSHIPGVLPENSRTLGDVLVGESQVPIPLMEDRVRFLCEVGTTLVERFVARFPNLMKECENSAVKLLQGVLENFACIRDTCLCREIFRTHPLYIQSLSFGSSSVWDFLTQSKKVREEGDLGYCDYTICNHVPLYLRPWTYITRPPMMQ